MTQDQSRAEFEAWAVNEGLTLHAIALLTDPPQFGGYSAPATSQAWKVWHAARAAAPALPPILNDAMRAVLINEHDVYQTPEALYEALLAAHRGCEEATDQAETRMDTGVDRGCKVLPAGWALVPAEPNVQMRTAGANASNLHAYSPVGVYAAMLAAAPQPPAAPAQAGWIPVSERLPEPGMPVLLDIGKKYPIRAMWAPRFTLEEGSDDPSFGFAEYSEEHDKYFCPEGWYEWNEHEQAHWYVSPTPIAWMPLPQPPKEQT